MSARALLELVSGDVPPELWAQMAAEESPPLRDETAACPECPLRAGGCWEDAALEAFASAPGVGRLMATRFVCHIDEGYCSGARRIAAAVSGWEP